MTCICCVLHFASSVEGKRARVSQVRLPGGELEDGLVPTDVAQGVVPWGAHSGTWGTQRTQRNEEKKSAYRITLEVSVRVSE